MNRRQQIRSYVVTKLRERNLVTGEVYTARRYPLTQDELPSFAVNIDREHSELCSESAPMVRKVAQLTIEVVADGRSDSVDMVLDELTSQVESIFIKDQTFNNHISRAVLKSCEISYLREGERDFGFARMEYEATYYASPEYEMEDLNDFQSTVVTLNQKESA